MRSFDELCEVLENWEPGKKFVTAEVAREFGVSLTDASNKIKLLAIELGVDIPELTIHRVVITDIRTLEIQGDK